VTQAKVDGEIGKVVQGVKNEYLAALAKENSLAGALNAQKGDALAMNRKAIDYSVLDREVQSGRQLYDSLLQRAKELMPAGFTKSGLMVGLGESREEIMQVMDDLRAAKVDFLTIGQYLQPTRKHAKLERFWTPEEFASLESIARAKGFLMVSASPLTRSSYHADSDFAELKAARAAKA